MKLKVCGMKFPQNISEIESLRPDFMGFIFYNKSKRFFDQTNLVYTLESNAKSKPLVVSCIYSFKQNVTICFKP